MQEEQTNNVYLRELTQEKYKYGFTTDIHTDIIEKGLNEDVIRLISAKKDEPEWLLEFRLKAYRHWLTMEMPTWAHLEIPEMFTKSPDILFEIADSRNEYISEPEWFTIIFHPLSCLQGLSVAPACQLFMS